MANDSSPVEMLVARALHDQACEAMQHSGECAPAHVEDWLESAKELVEEISPVILAPMQAAIDRVRALHVYTDAGVEYTTDARGGITGTQKMLWCSECNVRFWDNEKCDTIAALEGGAQWTMTVSRLFAV